MKTLLCGVNEFLRATERKADDDFPRLPARTTVVVKPNGTLHIAGPVGNDFALSGICVRDLFREALKARGIEVEYEPGRIEI